MVSLRYRNLAVAYEFTSMCWPTIFCIYRETKVFLQYVGRYTRKQLRRSELPTCFYCAGSIQNVNHRCQYSFFASLAQLAEQRTLNPWVTGSIPVGGMISKKADSSALFSQKILLKLVTASRFLLMNNRGWFICGGMSSSLLVYIMSKRTKPQRCWGFVR